MESDIKHIERAIKNYKRRKILGAIFMAFSAICCFATISSYFYISTKTTELTNSLLSLHKEGSVLTDSDIELLQATNKLTYTLGVKAGSSMSFLAVSTGASFGYSLYFLLGARRERIIMELYDKSKA